MQNYIPGTFWSATGLYRDVYIVLMRFLIDFKQFIFSECIPRTHTQSQM